LFDNLPIQDVATEMLKALADLAEDEHARVDSLIITYDVQKDLPSL